jgi:hypothetical protein
MCDHGMGGHGGPPLQLFFRCLVPEDTNLALGFHEVSIALNHPTAVELLLKDR